MKKQIQSIRFFLLAGLLISGFALSANNNATNFNACDLAEELQCFNSSFNYSWSVEPGAVSYEVELVNTSTQERFSGETYTTSITIFGLPSGTYNLTVTAKFADSTSSVIITDMINH